MFAASGIVLSAVYMLYLYKRIIFGTIVNPKLEKILDLSIREISILLPMAIIVIWIGIFPNSFLEHFQQGEISCLSKVQMNH